MANTLTDKINLLLNTKTNIQTAISECGISMPTGTPFSQYKNYIKQIYKLEDTTDTQDLLQMCDLVEELETSKYIEHTYNTAEIKEVENLIDYILEGGISSE